MSDPVARLGASLERAEEIAASMLADLSAKPIDPGAEFSKPRGEKLPWLLGFIERNPACTLAGGEGKILLDEIRRLEGRISNALHYCEDSGDDPACNIEAILKGELTWP